MFKEGPAAPGTERYTLLWLQPQSKARMVVRVLEGGVTLTGKGPDEVRKILEDPPSDWDRFFAEEQEYRRMSAPPEG